MKNIDQMMIDEWRELGFYYDSDDRLEVNQWRFFGSRQGLQNFVILLDKYIIIQTKTLNLNMTIMDLTAI